MAEPASPEEQRLPLPGLSARGRVLLGMVLANRPWLLAAGLKSALVAALATGAVATIEPTVWSLASSLSGWRLVAATVASITIIIAWIVIDGRLWDRPDDDSLQARERSRLYNTSTLLTLTIGIVICYLALYVVNLAWALFVLDTSVMSESSAEPSKSAICSCSPGSSRQRRRSAGLWARVWSPTMRSAPPPTRSARRSDAPAWRTSAPEAATTR